jgi:1,4-alpha-glucan branching enzyme
MPAFTVPSFNTMVIYELHRGTFNNTFAGAVDKLDYPVVSRKNYTPAARP